MEDKMDLSILTEDDLSSKAVYVVMDRRCHINDTEFAKNSLPPNLILNATSALPDTSIIGVWAKENIPSGTRYNHLESIKMLRIWDGHRVKTNYLDGGPWNNTLVLLFSIRRL